MGGEKTLLAPITRTDAPRERADNIFLYSKVRLLQAIFGGLAGRISTDKMRL